MSVFPQVLHLEFLKKGLTGWKLTQLARTAGQPAPRVLCLSSEHWGCKPDPPTVPGFEKSILEIEHVSLHLQSKYFIGHVVFPGLCICLNALFFFSFFFSGFICMYMYVWPPHACSTQKRRLNSLELELDIVVSCPACAGN